MRISDAASLALHAAVLLAARPAETVSTREMAEVLPVSEAHLAKVMQRLAKAGLVQSTRGPGGGFRLGRSAESITLLEVYEAVEGRLESSECLLSSRVCEPGQCILGGLLEDVNRRVREYLSATRLSQLTEAFASVT